MCYVKIQENVLLKFGVLIKEKKLNTTCFLVYTRLLMRRNSETWYCFPSHNSLANELGVTKPTIIDAISRLEENGMLIVIRKKKLGKGDKKDVNKYFFPIEVDLMNSDETKKLAIKVSAESYEAWLQYYKSFIEPMRKEKLKIEEETIKQSSKNITIETPKEFPF